jgi:vacuolar-type H+-ATPase subunit E/Vma4
MKSIEENIELLSRAVLGEAREKADQVLTDAKMSVETIRQQAQEQAAEERTRIIKAAQEEADRIRGQAIATTQLKARTMELGNREKLLDDVFKEVRKQLFEVQQWSDYGQIAKDLLREGLIRLKASKAEFHADSVTMKYLSRPVLDEIAEELKMQIVPGSLLEQGIGVIVETDKGHIHYDNTLETRLSRSQNVLRSPVYRLMMGEML